MLNETILEPKGLLFKISLLGYDVLISSFVNFFFESDISFTFNLSYCTVK